MLEIKVDEIMGRGLYATENIETGTVVSICELLILNPIDTIAINQTDLRYYVFKFNQTQDCLVLGNGEIFNHSETPNVSFSLEKMNNRFVMVFRSISQIIKSNQLFINYGSDEKVETIQYIKNPSLIA